MTPVFDFDGRPDVFVIPDAVWWLAIAWQAARLYHGGIFHRRAPLDATPRRIVESELVP